jgi:hypothetical protein
VLATFLYIVPCSLCCAESALWPEEGSRLHYRIIDFGSEVHGDCVKYILQVAPGHFYKDLEFAKAIVLRDSSTIGNLVATVPFFGNEYTWRWVYVNKSGNRVAGLLHHFATKTCPNVDTAKVRLRVIKSALKYKDAFLLLDGCNAMFNMKGEPLWFLPDIDDVVNEKSLVRDMKVTPQGTITLLVRDRAYEISYDGKILWSAPPAKLMNGVALYGYHHEFTKLANGHYLVLGSEQCCVAVRYRGGDDSSLLVTGDELRESDSVHIVSRNMPFANIVEFDIPGKVVWEYRSSAYFTGSDILYHRDPDGSVNCRVHDNGFFFDERSQTILISFKDISRLLKVSYPDGKVLGAYGGKFTPQFKQGNNSNYCYQHCCKVAEDGSIYLYNNNSCHPAEMPSVVRLRAPKTGSGELSRIAEYKCTLEEADKKDSATMEYGIGGSVTSLPDQSFFVSMSGNYGKMFIVSPTNEILWSAMAEKFDSNQKIWLKVQQYRTSIVMDAKQKEALLHRSDVR